MTTTIPHASRIGLKFLRMIAKEFGVKEVENLGLTSWELLDCIIRDIHLRNDERKRLIAENKRLRRKVDMMWIDAWKDFQVRNFGESKEKLNAK